MASAMQSLRLTALRGTYRVRPRRPIANLLPLASTFSSNTHSFHSSPNSQASSSTGFASTLPERARAFYESLSREDKEEYERISSKLDQHMSTPWVKSRLNAKVSDVLHSMPEEEPEDPPERIKGGLMSMGEVDEYESGEDEVFEGDDMTSIAHAQLEQHRELREYARIAAWEMPLLSKLVTPFEPPTSSTPLRFRHTDYLGETHPAANKIVLEFTTADLPLTPPQRLILVKLLGVRYDPQKDLAKISCEMFETPAQNKRYLGDLVDTLMSEARERDAEDGDRFADVPYDFRHVKWKSKPKFPEEWKLTEARRAELEGRRLKAEQAEERRIEMDRIVDGVALIEDAVRRAPLFQPVPIQLGRGSGAMGTGRRRSVR